MATINRFRIDNNHPAKDELEFFLKVNNESNRKLLSLCIDGDGIYYYKKGSQVLTPKENARTRDTYDGYLEMEEVRQIFESLAKAGWSRKKLVNEEIALKISASKGKVTIEVVDS